MNLHLSLVFDHFAADTRPLELDGYALIDLSNKRGWANNGMASYVFQVMGFARYIFGIREKEKRFMQTTRLQQNPGFHTRNNIQRDTDNHSQVWQGFIYSKNPDFDW